MLKTLKYHTTTNLANGTYIRFGLKDMITPVLVEYNAYKNIPDHILKMEINIEGLTISRSSKSQLRPVLISILNLQNFPNNVIPIGLFHGFKKPQLCRRVLESFNNRYFTSIEKWI